MIARFDGKAITNDAENRVIEVVLAGVTTQYVYGADGSRVKRIDDADSGNETVTLTFDQVEIRNFGQDAAEVITTYPHPSIRLTHEAVDGAIVTKCEVLTVDQLGSVRLIPDGTGTRANRKTYYPPRCHIPGISL